MKAMYRLAIAAICALSPQSHAIEFVLPALSDIQQYVSQLDFEDPATIAATSAISLLVLTLFGIGCKRMLTRRGSDVITTSEHDTAAATEADDKSFSTASKVCAVGGLTVAVLGAGYALCMSGTTSANGGGLHFNEQECFSDDGSSGQRLDGTPDMACGQRLGGTPDMACGQPSAGPPQYFTIGSDAESDKRSQDSAGTPIADTGIQNNQQGRQDAMAARTPLRLAEGDPVSQDTYHGVNRITYRCALGVQDILAGFEGLRLEGSRRPSSAPGGTREADHIPPPARAASDPGEASNPENLSAVRPPVSGRPTTSHQLASDSILSSSSGDSRGGIPASRLATTHTSDGNAIRRPLLTLGRVLLSLSSGDIPAPRLAYLWW